MRPPSTQPMKRCSDRSATACRVLTPVPAITGADITTAIVIAICVTCGRSTTPDLQTATTEIAERKPCKTAGHCAPSRSRQPGAVGGGSACQSWQQVDHDDGGDDADHHLERAVEGDIESLRRVVQALQEPTMLEVMVSNSQARPCGLTCIAITPGMVIAARNRQSAKWS